MKDFDINDISIRVDWSPFFIVWELKGKYPQIFNDPAIGVEARKVFDDAQKMLKDLIDKKLLTANGALGLFPANSVGDDIEVYADESRKEVVAVFRTLRQQAEKTDGQPYYALADFIAPKDSGIPDYLGGFAVYFYFALSD